MLTDYNKISALYKKAKEQKWRIYIEGYSLLSLVGDVTGKKVIDIACGEGFVTRMLRQAGTAKVVGVDVSERMIELARAQEAAKPLGIEYFVEDARIPGPQQDFDLAVAAWLLVYARNRTELDDMCRALARRLRPGGRFVTFTTNPDVYFYKGVNYRKYGFDCALESEAKEGATITFTTYLDGESLEIENYYLPKSAYEASLIAAGFRDVRIINPSLAADADPPLESGFWDDILNYPPAMLIECVKE